jgi:hypothetical protein
MQQADIFQPFFGVIILTFAVWFYMYIRRLSFLHTNKVDPAALSTPYRGARVVPENVSLAAFNFSNLLELPLLFYAVCLYLFVSGSVDSVHLACAWWFFVFRVIHSLVHCTLNHVVLRFSVYILGSLGLWAMIVRASLNVY